MSKNWNHSLCDSCWEWLRPDREPVRVKAEFTEQELCCLCALPHKSGIYIRRDPEVMPCRFFSGIHDPILKG